MKYERNERVSTASATDGIELILGEGEQILWQGKPKKSAYLVNKVLAMLPIALLWLAFDSVFVVMTFLLDMPTVAKIIICAFVCFHLIPFWMWLSNVLTASKRYKNTQYALTSHRIVIKTGFVGVDLQSISYRDIQHVNLKIGLIDRLLHVGDLYFVSQLSRNQGVFFDIDEPYEVYRIAQKIVSDIQTDIAFPNAYRPGSNPGYHTKIEP